VTRWPVRQAVLAAACEDDSRAAERFELYVNGLELCNGFQELSILKSSADDSTKISSAVVN
jgi:lysyl-tRNA synthetase class 2